MIFVIASLEYQGGKTIYDLPEDTRKVDNLNQICH